MVKMSKHGGARRGAGQPKMKPRDRRMHVNLTLPVKLVEQLNKEVAFRQKSPVRSESIEFRLWDSDDSTT
jgi:hypothetical protein